MAVSNKLESEGETVLAKFVSGMVAGSVLTIVGILGYYLIMSFLVDEE